MIKPLTSIRFLFALMVFFSHLKLLNDSDSLMLQWMFSSIFEEGYIGVSFFFILSGFILALNYQNHFAAKKNIGSRFYVARFARIYPLHLLTFIIAIPLTYNEFVMSKLHWLFSGFLNSTLLHSFIPNKYYYFSFNIPTWSISNEMFFYLLFPFLVKYIYSLSSSIYKIIFLLLALIMGQVLAIYFIPENLQHWLIYINPLFRVSEFILGIALFNLYKRVETVLGKKTSSMFESISILCLIIFFVLHNSVPQVLRFSLYYWIPMSLLIFVFSFHNGVISKILSYKLLVYLGEISFGFYMIHQLVLRYIVHIDETFLRIGNPYILIALILSITLVASHLSFRYFETPVCKYIKKRFQ